MLERYSVFAGRYRVGSRLGVGGMGEVYLAFDQRLARNVALKTLLIDRDQADYRPMLERFEREAKTLALLHHTNIVTVHDFGTADGTPYLVMNHFDGDPILRWGVAAEPNLAEWLHIARVIIVALEYAHSHGVLHRDIKPSNILVRGPRENPEVNIVDWGIALPVQIPRLTQAGSFVGTYGWVDPLLLASSKNAWTVQSDLYSVGVLLYSLLCNASPIEVPEDASPADRMRLLIANQVVPPELRNPAITPELSAFMMRLLATAPEQRTASTAAAIDELDPILAELRKKSVPRPPLEPITDRDLQIVEPMAELAAAPTPATVHIVEEIEASLVVPASRLGVVKRKRMSPRQRLLIAGASVAVCLVSLGGVVAGRGSQKTADPAPSTHAPSLTAPVAQLALAPIPALTAPPNPPVAVVHRNKGAAQKRAVAADEPPISHGFRSAPIEAHP